MSSNVEIVTGEDNTKQFLSAWNAAVKRGLTKIGMQAALPERSAKTGASFNIVRIDDKKLFENVESTLNSIQKYLECYRNQLHDIEQRL